MFSFFSCSFFLPPFLSFQVLYIVTVGNNAVRRFKVYLLGCYVICWKLFWENFLIRKMEVPGGAASTPEALRIMQCDAIWYDTVRYDMIWYDMTFVALIRLTWLFLRDYVCATACVNRRRVMGKGPKCIIRIRRSKMFYDWYIYIQFYMRCINKHQKSPLSTTWMETIFEASCTCKGIVVIPQMQLH